MYAERVLPTVGLIQARLNSDTQIRISNTKLKLVLHELSFCFRKTEDNRRVVCEKPEAIAARAHYLRAVRKYRELDFQIVYIDETWINQDHCRSLAWYPKWSVVDSIIKDKKLEKLNYQISHLVKGNGSSFYMQVVTDKDFFLDVH